MRDIDHEILAHPLQLFQFRMLPLELLDCPLQMLASLFKLCAEHAQLAFVRRIEMRAEIALG